ncbi:MAG: nitroreductase family deazaflavin-dependent oxidoreductase [Pseudonocardia sp.]|nr:nitroreductase family deazaflavin-dependent oxidoreductase [Pseudonocardia sp.]
MGMVQNVAAVVNTVVRPLVASPRWGRLVDRWMTVVTYTGRRSGRTFSIPVGYRRDGDELTIAVEMPDRKNWWRNFTGEGAPILVRLGGVDRAGHGTARRDDQGVRVSVRLSV